MISLLVSIKLRLWRFEMFRVLGVNGLEDVLFGNFVDCFCGILEWSVGVWDYGVEIEVVKDGWVMGWEEFSCLVDGLIY